MTDDSPRIKGDSAKGRENAGQMVVAIGGSAGGLQAFRGLIAGLPARSGIAYILVQHLDPDHPSILAELLDKDTPLPVIEATDGMALKPDRIHVIPSGALISVAGGALCLQPSKESGEGPRLPIDHLLRSLAQDTDLRMIAVILSGNGSDGREGVRAVHDAGGLVIVQDPAEAAYDSMPKAAIATECIDAVLPVAAMGAAIIENRNMMMLPKDNVKPAPWLEPVLNRLKAGGHDFSGYKVGTMQRRIERRARMAGHHPGTMPGYIERLGRDITELQTLANDLLINVTSFFRDDAVFATLTDKILPDLVQDHEGDGPIRLWSAGCSTGEEAWSLAILVLEEIARSRPHLKLQLFGTDLDPDAIAKARRGVYAAGVVERVSPARLERYFIADDHGWRTGPALQSSVVFAVHDLLVDPPFSRIDLVSCRNLLIYLQPEAQARAISLFEFAVRPGGLLLLGKAEAVPDKTGAGPPVFTLVSKDAHLYRRRDGHRAVQYSGKTPLPFPGRSSPTPPWPLPGLPSTRLQALEDELASIRAELAKAHLNLEGADAEQLAIHADTISRNEEYQTTNEELLTSQEELQSLNEELVALNGQLQETIDRQRVTSDDLQNILYSTDIATIFLDLGNKIRFFTPTTRVVFNLLPGDIGRPLADLNPLVPDPKLFEDITSVLIGHALIEREVESTAGVCFCRCVMPYRTHDQKVEGVIITHTDVTEQKRITKAMHAARESAEAANLAKSRFLAAASHDLRQPLQALVLLQELMARKNSDPAMRPLLGRLDHTLEAMSAMLDGLLDINRIEAGAVQIETADFCLDALFTETVGNMALQASARGLTLRHVKTSCCITSDRRLLAGMLQNLVANAIKYTSEGGVLLGARRRGTDVVIEVWDSGIGIAADEIESVFEPYRQLEPGIGDNVGGGGGGLGLGLSIVRSLGDMLGHVVSARSKLGHGSVFRIHTPQAKPAIDGLPGSELPAEPPTAKTMPPQTGTAHILLIDDDSELLDLLGLMLRDGGYQVVQARDEAAARKALKTRRPDLIVSDFRLLGQSDGLKLAQSLRATIMEAEGRMVPVIMLTGDISIDSLARFIDQDCLRLSKPVRPAALFAAVEEALSKRHPQVPATGLASIVHVIDDDPALLRELSVLLAEAAIPARLHISSEAFRAAWVPGKAGCLLVDAYLPGESGLDLVRALKDAGTLPPSIVITGRGDIAMAVEAMKAGAMDFLEKPVRGAAILASLRRALALGRDKAAHDEERRANAARLATLTERQTEIMHLVLAGHPSKNIAADLDLSQRTVENHRAEIMRRTGCKSIPELARLVMTADPE